MNDRPTSPSDSIGDAALEARIVAWILGEASPFETAELERLCEERPELLDFCNRMRTLHDLLSESESEQPEDMWKLSPERRKALDEIAGNEVVAFHGPEKDERIRHSGRRALLAVAACLVLTFVVMKMVAPEAGSAGKEDERKVAFSSKASPAARIRTETAQAGDGASMKDQERLDSTYPMAWQSRTRTSGMQEDAQRRQIAKSSPTPTPAAQPPSAPTVKSELADSSAVESIPGQMESGNLEFKNPIPEAPSDAFAPAAKDAQLAQNDVSNLVRRGLYRGEGNFNLGKYDEAKRVFDEVLRVEPDNTAAKRGLERIATAKSDYDRASYDHTRSELLSQVDAAWELSVPKESDAELSESKLPALALSKKVAGSPALSETPTDQSLSSLFAARRKGGVADGAEPLGLDLKDQEPRNSNQDMIAGLESKPAKILSKQAAGLGGSAPASPPPVAPAEEKAVIEEEPPAMPLTAEISAAENDYSTFSLNVNDASFRIAQAALEKGERPDPTSIQIEQFYNAVDYGDPAPAGDEPVAATIEQSVHPVIPGRTLIRVALRTGATGRSAAQPLRLTLLVDQSGSMVREDRRMAMDNALKQLSKLLTKDDKVSVIGFSRTSRLIADGMNGDQSASLSDLVNQAANEGGTNLEEALKLGGEMARRHQLLGAQNRIVLFTDGAANLGDANPARLAEQVKALRQQGISTDIAGIGADGLNDRLLGEVARNGNGRYYVVGNEKDGKFADQLAGAFRPAAGDVKVQVKFNPQRVGKYKLIGFEKDRLKTEDFRNDAVDAAELAAEEAGVALYQVEVLPGGTGEIGEVSVRFWDTSKGEMVERSWTVPHDDAAPAFDRALPSMQLAGLSMLAAQKLQGGPEAEAIDFTKFSATIADVKRFYGSNRRVGEMLRVVDAVK